MVGRIPTLGMSPISRLTGALTLSGLDWEEAFMFSSSSLLSVHEHCTPLCSRTLSFTAMSPAPPTADARRVHLG